MRSLIQLGVVAFTITLGIVVGNRLSSEAMAVVVGVVCGVLASIPMSIVILMLTRGLREGASQRHDGMPAGQRPAYPPVVVIQADGRGQNTQVETSWDAPVHREKRSFTVVGDNEDW